MESNGERSGKLEVLKLEGDLTIERAGELKLALMEAIESANGVLIQLIELKKVDLTALQLLCSAHRSALMSKKRLFINNSTPAIFRDVVNKAGFARHMGCTLNPDKGCLWVEGAS